MPKCAFKNCKNNHRNSCVSNGVSFFSFPNNPFRCEEWVAIVARERKNAFYKPSKRSVICSNHFEKCDISENKKRQRLVSTAVPKLQVEPITDDEATASTPTQKKRTSLRKSTVCPRTPIEFNSEEHSMSLPLKIEITEEDHVILPNTKNEENPVISQPIQEDIIENNSVVSLIKIEINKDPEMLTHIKKEIIEQDPLNTMDDQDTTEASISDLIPITETPKESYLMNQLNKCRQIIIDKSRRIQNLQKVNKRLVRKNRVLKNTIKVLKKMRKISDIIDTEIDKEIM